MVETGRVSPWCKLGVRRYDLCRCFWQETGFSRHEDVPKFKCLYKGTSCHTFNEFCKTNSEINCTTVELQKKRSFSSILTGHTTLPLNLKTSGRTWRKIWRMSVAGTQTWLELELTCSVEIPFEKFHFGVYNWFLYHFYSHRVCTVDFRVLQPYSLTFRSR
jgi:hypothetical protein